MGIFLAGVEYDGIYVAGQEIGNVFAGGEEYHSSGFSWTASMVAGLTSFRDLGYGQSPNAPAGSLTPNRFTYNGVAYSFIGMISQTSFYTLHVARTDNRVITSGTLDALTVDTGIQSVELDLSDARENLAVRSSINRQQFSWPRSGRAGYVSGTSYTIRLYE